MTDSAEAIRALARQTARSGLQLKHARRVFEALYLADALIKANHNVLEAAEIAGIERGHFYRMTRALDGNQ